MVYPVLVWNNQRPTNYYKNEELLGKRYKTFINNLRNNYIFEDYLAPNYDITLRQKMQIMNGNNNAQLA